MQSLNPNTDIDNRPQSDSNMSILECTKLIFEYRRIIGCIAGTALILSVIISMLLPKMYVATTRVLPPQDSSPGLTSIINTADDPLEGLAGSLFSKKTPAALYVGIMNSRSVADALNEKFDLKELYGFKYIEDVYDKLKNRSVIEISKKNKIIVVSVKDRDPQRAADMANTYVALLDKINRKVNITQGKRKRLFLEERLKEVRTDLEIAEMELKSFQEKYHLVSIEEQAKVAIEGAAEIKGEIIAAQTELEVLKQFGTEKQVEAVMLNAKIEELQNQLESIEQGDTPDSGNSLKSSSEKESNFYIPFGDLPRLGMQLIRLTRETKIQEKLFELLTAQYEMARIEEAKDVDTIQVLDSAVAPEKKSSPKRFSIVIAAVIFSTMLSVFFVLLVEYAGWSQIIKTKLIEVSNRAKTLLEKKNR